MMNEVNIQAFFEIMSCFRNPRSEVRLTVDEICSLRKIDDFDLKSKIHEAMEYLPGNVFAAGSKVYIFSKNNKEQYFFKKASQEEQLKISADIIFNLTAGYSGNN